MALTTRLEFGMILPMPDDKRSDEDLVRAYKSGDNLALDVLITRYYDRIGHFLLINDWQEDYNNREDVRHIIFLKVIELLKANKFDPEGPNTFRSWLYLTAQHIRHQEENKYTKRPVTFDKKLADVIPSDITATRPVDEITQGAEDISAAAEQILSALEPEDRLLLTMTGGDDKISYKKMREKEPFIKYSEADLRQRVCRLRKHLFKEVLKWQKKANQ